MISKFSPGDRVRYIGEKFPAYREPELVAHEFLMNCGQPTWNCSFPDAGRPTSGRGLTTWLPQEDLEDAA